jgi:hypothetical protein
MIRSAAPVLLALSALVAGTLVLMPIGVLWIGNDGSTWFGQPAT